MTNSTVCADASLLLKLAVEEAGSQRAAQEWTSWVANGVTVTAPSLIWYELTSILVKRWRRGDLTADEADGALETLLLLRLDIVSGSELHRAAHDLAIQLGHSAAYDAHYLAVALAATCPLWTADRGMFTAAKQAGIETHLIS